MKLAGHRLPEPTPGVTPEPIPGTTSGQGSIGMDDLAGSLAAALGVDPGGVQMFAGVNKKLFLHVTSVTASSLLSSPNTSLR